ARPPLWLPGSPPPALQEHFSRDAPFAETTANNVTYLDREGHTKNGRMNIRCPVESEEVVDMFRKLSLIAGGLVIAAAPVFAHHAFSAEFDANKPIKLTGPITKVELVNPHAWIHLEVKDAKTGKTEEWMVEGGTPNT